MEREMEREQVQKHLNLMALIKYIKFTAIAVNASKTMMKCNISLTFNVT